MWKKLDQVMLKFGLANPNFKGFKVNNAHPIGMSFRLHIVYNFGNPSMKMVDKEQTCLFYWT
jgi:hypothetical protein